MQNAKVEMIPMSDIPELINNVLSEMIEFVNKTASDLNDKMQKIAEEMGMGDINHRTEEWAVRCKKEIVDPFTENDNRVVVMHIPVCMTFDDIMYTTNACIQAETDKPIVDLIRTAATAALDAAHKFVHRKLCSKHGMDICDVTPINKVPF